MAGKVDIAKLNESLGAFLDKADTFKVSKDELFENMKHIEKAIPLFEKLTNLYNQLDPSSPRARNYFALASSVASIPEGALLNNALIQREAALADHAGADKDGRLTSDEVRDLKFLMGSAKLKPFREFFDIENLAAFEDFRRLIQGIKADPAKGATASEAATQRAFSISNAVDDKKAMQQDSEAADSEGKKKGKQIASFDLDLVSAEAARKDREQDREVAGEVRRTSEKIAAEVGRKSNTQRKSKVSFVSKVWKAPKGTWLGDLMQIVKWVGGAAATLGTLSFAASKLNEWFDEARIGQKELIDALDNLNKKLDEERAGDVGMVENRAAAEAYMTGIQKNMEDPRFKGLFPSLKREDVSMITGLMTRPIWERSMAAGMLEKMLPDASKAEINLYRAVLQGKKYAENGRGGILPLEQAVLMPTDDPDRQVQALYRTFEVTPTMQAYSLTRRPEWSTSRRNFLQDPVGYPINGLADLVSWARNGIFAGGKRKLKDGMTIEKLEGMTPDAQMRYFLDNYMDALYDRLVNSKNVDTNAADVAGVGFSSIPITIVGEVLAASSDSRRAWLTNSKVSDLEVGQTMQKWGYFGDRKLSDKMLSEYGRIARNIRDTESPAAYNATREELVELQTGTRIGTAREEPVVVNQVTNINNTVVDGSNRQNTPEGMS